MARIDAAALRANFATLRAAVAPGVRILAVVKADGYGHGGVAVARILAAAGADFFGVATLEEAIELREAGVGAPILVLAGIAPADAGAAIAHDLSIAVIDEPSARALAARLGSSRLRVHVKLDTGMGRLGAALEDLGSLIEVLRATPALAVEGVFSHLGDAENPDSPYCESQIARFRDGVAAFRGAGIRPAWTHLANSAATLMRPDTHFDLVRPGIALYGPAPHGAGFGLRPVMHLVTRIWQLKSVPAGTPLGYGQTFVTRRPSRIAVLPIGYADGYDRSLSNRAAVLVHGRRAPVVGRVCMDLTLVDVTDIAGVQAGDEVVLWGRQGEGEITSSEVAAWQESIPYEVLTRVGKRVPRLGAGAVETHR